MIMIFYFSAQEAAASEIPIMIAANTDRMVNVMRKLLMDAARELYDETDIERDPAVPSDQHLISHIVDQKLPGKGI